MKTTPDYETAALRAAETLIKYQIRTSPIFPLTMLKQTPGVLVVSFEEMSSFSGVKRIELVELCGVDNQDAVTTVFDDNGSLRYVVTYNQQLPMFLVQRALARELGHIVLGHDGTLSEDVRFAEAKCFAQHLLCPRPLIHSIQAISLRFTEAVLNNLTGCNENCLACMRRLPGVHVPSELNAAIRDQFMPYILNFFHYQRSASRNDLTAVVDFGTYMDGYKE